MPGTLFVGLSARANDVFAEARSGEDDELADEVLLFEPSLRFVKPVERIGSRNQR